MYWDKHRKHTALKIHFPRAWKPWGPSSCWNVMVLRAGGSSRGFANRFSLRQILVNMYAPSLSQSLSNIFLRSLMHSPHSAHCATETLKSEKISLNSRAAKATLLSCANISLFYCMWKAEINGKKHHYVLYIPGLDSLSAYFLIKQLSIFLIKTTPHTHNFQTCE